MYGIYTLLNDWTFCMFLSKRMFLSKNDMATHAWHDIVGARVMYLLIIIVPLCFRDVGKQAKGDTQIPDYLEEDHVQ